MGKVELAAIGYPLQRFEQRPEVLRALGEIPVLLQWSTSLSGVISSFASSVSRREIVL